MSNDITTIQELPVSQVMQTAPVSYEENAISRQRCMAAGTAILQEIEQNGMDEALDAKAAEFIGKAQKTLAKMRDKRMPVTRLFDQVRKMFTAQENDVDPSAAQSVAWQLQQQRNKFAAYKRQLEEQERLKQLQLQQQKVNEQRYTDDVQADYRSLGFTMQRQAVDAINAIFNNVTIDTYDAVTKQISEYSDSLPEEAFTPARSSVQVPGNMSMSQAIIIRKNTLTNIMPELRTQYAATIADVKQKLLSELPGKLDSLRKMAAVIDEAEKEAMRIEMQKRDAEEKARLEAKMQEEKQRQEAAAKMAQQQAAINDMFNQSSTVSMTSETTTKVKVRQVIQLLSPDGIMPVIALWWQEEGCHMSIDELTKMFKRQVTFANKLANEAQPVLIDDESVTYVEEVKAK